MKPVKTPGTNINLTLPGGTAQNDLPATRAMLYNEQAGERPQDAQLGYVTTWQPTDAEARRLEAGACVELTVWGKGHPPVAVSVTRGVVPERELIDRGHVDRAIGHLYGQLRDLIADTGYNPEDHLPDPAEFVELWAQAVDTTRPPEAGGPGDGAVAGIPDDASRLEEPDTVPAPPYEDCRAPDRYCPHRTVCKGWGRCTP